MTYKISLLAFNFISNFSDKFTLFIKINPFFRIIQNRIRRKKRREKDVIYVKFGKHFNKLNKVDKFKSRSFSVKELINLEKKKENVNSPKELNPRLPGRLNSWFGEIDVGQDERFDPSKINPSFRYPYLDSPIRFPKNNYTVRRTTCATLVRPFKQNYENL
ncbi:hypothetical protein BpHYR1_023941 [Brachionus plicatilis]|uniref:Uncharacterized protein n=1 Tax=Brachionus plicatilis TaxID=10195 RepID=A0A3M7R123_BRAPC|nr:hypothetical protein BpHYR1_023941 [Brachionus plicatilis]